MNRIVLVFLLSITLLCFSGCEDMMDYVQDINDYSQALQEYIGIVEELLNTVPSYATTEELPEYDGNIFVVIDDNKPGFTEAEITDKAYEKYSPLDLLGRCGPAEACIGKEIMPTEERGTIGDIRPTGWHTVKYDFIDGNYLYNRCHLMGYQLTGENSNVQNLITGTRHLNVEEMLPFENMVAEYVKETNHHVMYRVTPVYEGNNLLATGVEMEAYSVEDHGAGVSFHVFCYNVQPGIGIDYATGESWIAKSEDAKSDMHEGGEYILNISSYKYHLPTCESVTEMAVHNKQVYRGDKEDLENIGFVACRACNP